MKNFIKKTMIIAGFSFLALTGTANAEVSAETAYVFNTFSFLVSGFLVMLMALGFTCLEAGLVRTKNTATICVKNVALYSLAGIMFYLVGYGFMYNDVSGYIGTPALGILKLLLILQMATQRCQIGSSKWYSVQQLCQLLVVLSLKGLN